ncbi:hypothetical protein PRIPAC_97931 [Pristionchus pacificus]|uniref:Uncharacterized protein n=1 Tax=Pristionchus pacificus TaxID=54126 RepID=A0A2A6D282_PRIPA|nr:hypothetical protein PRIPAC_97931 [Pristionchus pacificus]|eukprot:PDM84582.1 hypothetical protein PRIPAC_33605 [Pristionchus pacificus]
MQNEKFIIKTPCLLYCSGATQTGKTTLLRKILKNEDKMFDKPIDRIIWCYGIDTGDFPKHGKIELHEGPPDMQMLEGKDHKLLILDDLMSYYIKNKTELNNLFTRVAHYLLLALRKVSSDRLKSGQI